MRWEFSDGTVVHLGGKVEGDSLFAQLTRETFEDCGKDYGPTVDDGPIPGPTVPMDPNNAHHVDVWLRNTARCLRVGIVSAPDVPPIEGGPLDVGDLPVLF
jgi:hypothetical protein